MEIIAYIPLAGLIGLMVLVAYLRYRISNSSRLPQSPASAQDRTESEPPPAHVDDRHAPGGTVRWT